MIGGRDDADLLVRLRRRDPEAAGLLFDRYGNAAYNLAIRILADPAAAEDAVAEALIKCWNRVASFRETRGGALGIWLLMTTYATALDRPSKIEHGATLHDWSKRLNTDRIQETCLALARLTLAERQFLDLTVFSGLTPAEAGTRTGLTKTEVDQLIQSALAKLAFLDHE